MPFLSLCFMSGRGGLAELGKEETYTHKHTSLLCKHALFQPPSGKFSVCAHGYAQAVKNKYGLMHEKFS